VRSMFCVISSWVVSGKLANQDWDARNRAVGDTVPGNMELKIRCVYG
jgi:hypothetical protein